MEFPFSKLILKPTRQDPVRRVFVDPELAKRAFTYQLVSGKEDSIHLDQVLEYNGDADYIRRMLLYQLTLVAQKALARTKVAKREVIRRMKTSPTQFYRLMDQTNTRKSIDEMVRLLTALDIPLSKFWKFAA